MPFVYHVVPATMHGEELIPLGTLEEKFPEAYRAAMKKYEGDPLREALPFRRIEKLKCRWRDILHFAPIHPSHLYRGIQEFFPDVRPNLDFYRVPVERLRGKPAVLFDMNRAGYKHGREDDDTYYDDFRPEEYWPLGNLPETMRDWYRHCKERGDERPLIFGRLPHVMVKGPVSVAGCEIVRWSALK